MTSLSQIELHSGAPELIYLSLKPSLLKKLGWEISYMMKSWIHTLSSKDRVDFKAPSGLPKGKQNLKFVNWNSSWTLSLSFISVNFSFSSWVTVPTPSDLKFLEKLKVYPLHIFKDIILFLRLFQVSMLIWANMDYQRYFLFCFCFKLVQGMLARNWISSTFDPQEVVKM